MATKKQVANGPLVIPTVRVRLTGPVRHHGDDYAVGDEMELAECEAHSLIAVGAAELCDLDLPELPAP